MAKRAPPAFFSLPPHRAFADALVAGIIAQHGQDRMAMARGIILVPNNRASAAIIAAFVRQADHGLLLPRLVAIGDADLVEAAGRGLDGVAGDMIAPAIDPLHRQLILAHLVQAEEPSTDPAEAMRLAGDLAHTLDQLIVEGIDPARLKDVAQAEGLSLHWQKSLTLLTLIMSRWPEALARLGRIDLAHRRNLLLARVAAQWEETPPKGFVIAAGISTAAPAVARLLKTVSRLPRGQVVFAGLDLDMPQDEWAAIAGGEDGPAIETHPQFHLVHLMGRIGIARAEVHPWRWGSDIDARAARSRAISNAMAPAEFTGKWETLSPKDRNVAGVTALVLATPAEEAQAIAIALRDYSETPGQTAALVTPDRNLALRVSAHLARWGIEADDSAGQRLSITLPGTLILLLAEAAAQRFAPVPLLALLKHMLVQAGEQRLAWLDGVRALDRALRGPRPAQGLSGITAFLDKGDHHARKRRSAAVSWWEGVAAMLSPLERVPETLGDAVAMLREALQALADDGVWQGEAGREAARLFEALERGANHGPTGVNAQNMPPFLRTVMDAIAVRKVYGGHPRIFIWGLLEAKLQSANLMILGGLNEGVWPALPAPDPWLAPRIRKDLKLPSLERRIGLSAHDLAGAMGAPTVIITRAKRDTSAPTIASRFWLRIEAMTGGLSAPALPYAQWARLIDQPESPPTFCARPAPCPPIQERPRTVSVTEIDGLKADPYAFYARKMLGLSALDAVDAEPGPSWRGSLIHQVLQDWAQKHDYDPDSLAPALAKTFADEAVHPVLRALWLPRLEQAAQWIAAQVADNRSQGRVPIGAEISGAITFGGITLRGRADRIDRSADGLAIIDYKTGAPPSKKQVSAGFASQLGLIGLIADRGGFEGVAGASSAFEYWALSRRENDRTFGWMSSPVGTGKNQIPAEEFVAKITAQFQDVIDLWLMGNAPFTAKLHPEYSYADYDQLMRLDEWRG